MAVNVHDTTTREDVMMTMRRIVEDAVLEEAAEIEAVVEIDTVTGELRKNLEINSWYWLYFLMLVLRGDKIFV